MTVVDSIVKIIAYIAIISGVGLSILMVAALIVSLVRNTDESPKK
jgi:hypothetical protein